MRPTILQTSYSTVQYSTASFNLEESNKSDVVRNLECVVHVVRSALRFNSFLLEGCVGLEAGGVSNLRPQSLQPHEHLLPSSFWAGSLERG